MEISDWVALEAAALGVLPGVEEGGETLEAIRLHHDETEHAGGGAHEQAEQIP